MLKVIDMCFTGERVDSCICPPTRGRIKQQILYIIVCTHDRLPNFIKATSSLDGTHERKRRAKNNEWNVMRKHTLQIRWNVSSAYVPSFVSFFSLLPSYLVVSLTLQLSINIRMDLLRIVSFNSLICQICFPLPLNPSYCHEICDRSLSSRVEHCFASSEQLQSSLDQWYT